MGYYGDSMGVIVQDATQVINAQFSPYKAVGDGVADDTAKLQSAINDSITKKVPLFIPAGTYRTTAGLTAIGSNVMIYGAGGNLTKIKPDAYTYDALVIGPGVSGSGQYPSGYLMDIDFQGITSWITGTTAALKLDGMRQFDVIRVNTERMPIGFDLINNCYGSGFYNCRSNLGGLPLNLRTGPQSGSDLTFDNCWFRGKDGAVWVAPDGGGYHFKNGQLTGGDNQGADNDAIGVIVLGKDYITSAVGNIGNINFDGIDFEGSKYIHQIRGYGQFHLELSNNSFLSTSLATTAEKPLGIIKATNALQSRINMINNTVAGNWKAIKAIDIAGQGSTLNIFEVGTAMVNGTVNFDNSGTPTSNDTAKSLLEQSLNTMGTAIFRAGSSNKILVGGMMIRASTLGIFEVSYDWGVTWVPSLQILRGTTAARPTTNNYPWRFYADTTLGKPIWRNEANTGWIDATGATV